MLDQERAEKTEVFKRVPVSRETKIKLEQYVALLTACNKRINLVAAGSMRHVWMRHILDSGQLFGLIPPKTQSVADLGSGAGFPGMVLAIMGVRGVHLIESVGKKASFLRNVAEELGVDIAIRCERIETIRNLKADVITARALKPLPQLLTLANPLMHKGSICLFLKGQKADEELTEARKYWTFKYEKHPSLSDPTGTVLKIWDLKAHTSHVSRRPRNSRKQRPS